MLGAMDLSLEFLHFEVQSVLGGAGRQLRNAGGRAGRSEKYPRLLA